MEAAKGQSWSRRRGLDRGNQNIEFRELGRRQGCSAGIGGLAEHIIGAQRDEDPVGHREAVVGQPQAEVDLTAVPERIAGEHRCSREWDGGISMPSRAQSRIRRTSKRLEEGTERLKEGTAGMGDAPSPHENT